MACCGSKQKEDADGILTGALSKMDASLVDKSLIHCFEERIKNGKIQPNKAAVHFGDSTVLTYAQLNTFASCLARNIIDRLGYDYKLNFDSELIIAICLPMSEKAIALLLGVLKTGAAYLPLDPEQEEDVILNVLSAFKPALLISDDNGNIFNKFEFEAFSRICNVMSIEELWLDTEFAHEPNKKRASMEMPHEIDVVDIASAKAGLHPVTVMHCPGIESETPVGVRLGNQSILNLVQYHWTRFKMTEKDSCCITVSISSPISIPQIFIPLLLGCTLHLFRRQDVSDMDSFLKNISWRKISRLSFPTHHLKPFLAAIEFQGKEKMLKSLKALKYVICRGSMIPLEEVAEFFTIFGKNSSVSLSNCTGSVQTTGEVAFETYTSYKDYESKLCQGRATLGLIVGNARIYILDKNMNIVTPNGSTGEICVSGNCLAIGYVGEGPTGENAKKSPQFIKNPFYDGQPMFERMYRTCEYGYILEGKRRLYLDKKHDELALKNDDDSPIEETRKW